MAYGHFDGTCERSFVVCKDDYIDALLDICAREKVWCLIPGAEEPMNLIAKHAKKFAAVGTIVLQNSGELVDLLSNKAQCFAWFARNSIPHPRTTLITKVASLDQVAVPAIVKPATGSGGSVMTFFARTRSDVERYANYLIENGKSPLAQEYISHDEGEYTVGVLSLPNKQIWHVTVLKRLFHVKLSVFARGSDFLISSGYSQGQIGEFPDIAYQCREIAQKLESIGPINIQGRIRDGVFLPFEINPRLSASTYLRAMAGVNEVGAYLSFLETGSMPPKPQIVPGYYLRSLAERFTPKAAQHA